MAGYDKKLKGNNRFTVVKVKLDEVDALSKVMGLTNPERIYYSEYVSEKIFERYPEWERARDVMHLQVPDYFLYEKDKPIVAIYDRLAFFSAPLLDE